MKTLDELVAGDWVIISSGIDNTWCETVVKVTKTQIVVSKDARYNRRTGLRCGSHGYYISRLRPATPDALDIIRRRKLTNRLIGLRREALEPLPLEALIKIGELLDEANKTG